MHSVKKLGFSVLQKLFPKKDLVKFKRETYIHNNSDWPLEGWVPDKNGTFSMGDLVFDFGYTFTVYGLELGVVHLKPTEGMDLLKLIENDDDIKRRKFLPSHIAKVHWNVYPNGLRKEQVSIHTLSKQEVTKLKFA